METDVIEVKLSIEENEAVMAHLIFKNRSERSIYLNKQVMYYNGEVRNNYFEIAKSNGHRVSFLGFMANCTRMPDEYVLLQPNEEISSAISLKEWYRLTKGENYIVRYYAFNPAMKQMQSVLMEMQSNKVEISY
ncbi:hypothetical protein [Niastella populi]|uniref:Uncharacterized protein n=1 Tax=Niastella populi TaxID=550983 RepID=A0A1V9GAM3_9BACT|nr:hypothetical protein [Niastella populi]OQP67617.1 hypothetical protein A4R26_12455 [Niastella populi]